MSTFVCVCVSLCLSARISPEPHARSLPIFVHFCLWLWLGPPPARLRHVMYFRFCGWHNVFSTPPGPWLPAAWYNKGCIHRLANPRKGCVSIAISMSVYLSVCLLARRSTKLHVRSLPNLNACCLRSWLDLPPAKGAKSTTIYLRLPCSVWRPSVCLSRLFLNVSRERGAAHTQRDSPGGSMRLGGGRKGERVSEIHCSRW